MKEKKLTPLQQQTLDTFRKYPNAIIMNLSDGMWLTGGHGVRFHKSTVYSLMKRGYITKSFTLSDKVCG